MSLLKTFLFATGVLLASGVFALEEAREKPWDDAEYYVESPDILTVEFAKPIQRFADKDEVLREKMSVNLLAFDVSGNIICSREFPIGPGGVIDLRELLNKKTARFVVGDLTISEAEELLQSQFPASQRVILPAITDLNRQSGNHLVEPDGYVTLGDENNQTRVYVNGLTVKEITEAIELAYSKGNSACEKGSVSVSVFAYNSKEYYVILQGAEPDQVYSFPCTEKENVLKAIANVNGLQQFSTRRIWIARPGVGNTDKPLMIPVDWKAVVVHGAPQMNHRIFPGDRVYVEYDGAEIPKTAKEHQHSPVIPASYAK